LSFYFHWKLDYILTLSPVQIDILLYQLGDILRQQNDPDYHKEQDEKKELKLREKIIEMRKAKGKKLKGLKG